MRRLAVVATVATLLGCAPPVTKKLIEFGWDEPGTAFLREHLGAMEKTPFDGCVFHVNYRRPDGGEGNFTWEAWSRRRFTAAELQPALDDLKALRPQRFRYNFLRFNVTPGDVDWFDDFTPVLDNARLAAHLAREGRLPGILFDDEPYESPLFDYSRQRDAATKSWDEYAAQARRRGRELMQALQDGYPHLTVFLTFGYALPFAQAERHGRPLSGVSCGLMAPFLDGMIDGVTTARLVDGYEPSYAYVHPPHFTIGYEHMRTGVLPIVGADHAKYRRVTSFGFGVWMDNDWRGKGWDTADPSRNYFTPEALEASLREALRVSDEYVWLYSETPRWWSASGGPENLPEAYDAAVRQARGMAR